METRYVIVFVGNTGNTTPYVFGSLKAMYDELTELHIGLPLYMVYGKVTRTGFKTPTGTIYKRPVHRMKRK